MELAEKKAYYSLNIPTVRSVVCEVYYTTIICRVHWFLWDSIGFYVLCGQSL